MCRGTQPAELGCKGTYFLSDIQTNSRYFAEKMRFERDLCAGRRFFYDLFCMNQKKNVLLYAFSAEWGRCAPKSPKKRGAIGNS